MTQPQELARERTEAARASRFARLRQAIGAWRARAWWPWAVGLSMLLTGALVGWLGVGLAVNAMVGGRPLAPYQQVTVGTDRAEIGGPATASGRPGAQVHLRWAITNTGESTWTPLTHRFAPEGTDSGLPVLVLPGKTWVQNEALSRVPPGNLIFLEAYIDIPATKAGGTWEPIWQLTGPKGPVAGGRLTAIITVTAP